MNNATLHTLVLAVKAHQRRERREALASGGDLPDGLFTFTPKTKKEMSRLIRSIQGKDGQSLFTVLYALSACVHARLVR